ncbi:hypothetical protein PQ455_14695 [Sphingomonas naphthae]|uniref:General secretion pathway protein N n=1 Tax=Sphingomonas naphthae TaxID=1813468 RepID=A0ABY7TI61_9SPHN|nr:hypothetical protein [Sphingomonas naphthae]WCT72873.1 hypothetical protein PQ455_14695 [Sphingomonas naphthae]
MSPTPGIGAIGGTVWRGHATLIDGSRAEWRWAPLRSLTGLGFAADWTIAGSGNDLAGVAVIGMNTTTIEAASGTASGAVLAAALPYLHFTCAMPLQVNIKRIRIGGGSQGAEGEVNAGSGLCAPRGGGAATLTPSMVLSLTRVGSDSRILLVPAGQRRRTLAEGSLSEDGKLQLRVTPEGSQVLPFAAPAGGIGIETSF